MYADVGQSATRTVSVLPDDQSTLFHGWTMAAKKKLTLYVTEDLLHETKQEALRQDRSISWILEQAWKISKDRLKTVPGVDEITLDEMAS